MISSYDVYVGDHLRFIFRLVQLTYYNGRYSQLAFVVLLKQKPVLIREEHLAKAFSAVLPSKPPNFCLDHQS